MTYNFVEGDTGVKVRVTCTEGDPATVIDLTNFTVKLRWKGVGAIQERTMTVINAVGGIVQYQFVADELTADEMEFEVVLTDTAGFTRTSLSTFTERVREKLA